MPKYVNAKNVLPEKLYRQVYEHFSGGMLYFPSQNLLVAKRKQIIINQAEAGTSSRDIADLLGITQRRVNQIIAANCNWN